jgi:methionyl aminopeptidase
MSLIKSPKQIELMREGGKILTEALDTIAERIEPGLDVWDLEKYFLNFCSIYNVIPACKGYTAGNRMPPYPTGLCVYVNDETVHCYPKKGHILKNGDIITIDTVIKYKNIFVDASIAVGVGNISKDTSNFLSAVRLALAESEKQVKPEVRIGQISYTMQKCAEKEGYNVLRDYAGHGIGLNMHEEPEIPCFGEPHDGIKLKEGMTICIEALLTEGKPEINYFSAWEAKMKDGKRYAQFEHTLLVTKNGYDILTPWRV